MNLSLFLEKNLYEAGIFFFKQLKVPLNSNTATSFHLKDILKDKFKSHKIFEKVSESYFLGLVHKVVFDDNLSLFETAKLPYELADKKIHAGYGGVGFVRNPPVFLKPGDTVKLTIDKIGTLSNPVA